MSLRVKLMKKRCFKDEEWKWVDQEKNEEKNDQIQKLQAPSRRRKLL